MMEHSGELRELRREVDQITERTTRISERLTKLEKKSGVADKPRDTAAATPPLPTLSEVTMPQESKAKSAPVPSFGSSD
jgi:hypothetical protein